MKRAVWIMLFLVLAAAAGAEAGDYIIGEGDTLGVSVWGVPELSVKAKVRPDGKITVPALGEVAAAGATPKELQARLSSDLTRMVKNPVVTVTVEEITNNRVYVYGSGVAPGVYNLTRRTTLLELLCQISDVRNADLKRAYVLRGGQKVKEGFHELFMKGDASEDIAIEPGDVIFFPSPAERNVYVVGAVKTPKAVEFREGLTAMEAILQAEGFSKFAKRNDVVIYRKDGEKEVTIPLKMKDLINDADLSQNVKLRPGDYIVVKEGMF
ncbi:MAG: polysaccharide biosynthesis/export family protein [Thermodesulfovibrionales bacterium]